MFFKKKENKKEINDNNYLKLTDDINDDIDPIAEADVYMTYGKYEQAMLILNEALKSGKISDKKYNDFITLKNLNNNSKEKQKLITTYTYYINLSLENNEYKFKNRFFIELDNKINTKNGIEELENKINKKINILYQNKFSNSEWTIDNYIEIIKE